MRTAFRLYVLCLLIILSSVGCQSYLPVPSTARQTGAVNVGTRAKDFMLSLL